MSKLPLENGLKPAARKMKLDNGLGDSAANYEEPYEAHGVETRTDTGNQGGDMGTKLDMGMKSKYGRHKEYR